MDIKMLDQVNHVDMESGCRCRYVRSDTEGFRPHFHNYYEIFLVLCGDVTHIANDAEQHLTEGQLLFIRDFDVHDYISADGNYFEFLNLAFTKDDFHAMVGYLGSSFPVKELLSSPHPPAVILSKRDKEKLFYSLTSLESGTDKAKIKMRLKTLLLNIFTQYFGDYSQNKTEIPLWLEMTYEKILSPENFIKGTERLYEICPKSREHLCRSLKKYYDTSPCTLITDLRLDYCLNLLMNSNLSITDICFECGFENISWFYKVFQKKYNLTPLQYRKKLHGYEVYS